jgi:hypothetical protein
VLRGGEREGGRGVRRGGGERVKGGTEKEGERGSGRSKGREEVE